MIALPDNIEKPVKIGAALVTAGFALFGAVKAVALIPYRIDRNLENIRQLQYDVNMYHEDMVRLEERVKFLEKHQFTN